MQTVVETPSYLSNANDAGVTEEERKAIVDELSANPTKGDLIVGTGGGCRKVRFAGRGKGKSGGYRVITYFAEETTPVFLLTMFGKGEKSDLSGAERSQLANLTATLVEKYRDRVKDLKERR